MKIEWKISQKDIKTVKEFISAQNKNPLVLRRIDRNINKVRDELTLERFWHAHVACLLTTQQRSGPNSDVNEFLQPENFNLTYESCSKKSNLEKFVTDTLSSRGIRRNKIIAKAICNNIEIINEGYIDNLQNSFNALENREGESKVCEHFKGLKQIGNKQSRNLGQMLGYFEHEIPIDSRIIKWLNTNVTLETKLCGQALSSEIYYDLVLDGINALCEKVEVKPCVLDAVIFASFDGDNWKEDKVIW